MENIILSKIGIPSSKLRNRQVVDLTLMIQKYLKTVEVARRTTMLAVNVSH